MRSPRGMFGGLALVTYRWDEHGDRYAEGQGDWHGDGHGD